MGLECIVQKEKHPLVISTYLMLPRTISHILKSSFLCMFMSINPFTAEPLTKSFQHYKQIWFPVIVCTYTKTLTYMIQHSSFNSIGAVPVCRSVIWWYAKEEKKLMSDKDQSGIFYPPHLISTIDHICCFSEVCIIKQLRYFKNRHTPWMRELIWVAHRKQITFASKAHLVAMTT